MAGHHQPVCPRLQHKGIALRIEAGQPLQGNGQNQPPPLSGGELVALEGRQRAMS